MGVTIDKSRGSTVVEGVFIKSVAKGKSADLAQSTSGGLRPGRYTRHRWIVKIFMCLM